MLTLLQESFIQTFIATPDEALVCQRLNLDALTLLDWSDNKEFQRKMKQAEKLIIGRIERDVAIQGIKNLQNVLKFGEKITTSTSSKKDALDMEGNIQELSTQKITQKINKSPSWAIREALKILMIRKMEDNISNNLQSLIDQGLVPESIKDQILSIIEDCDTKVQGVLGGSVQSVEISEQLLSEVQNLIVSGG